MRPRKKIAVLAAVAFGILLTLILLTKTVPLSIATGPVSYKKILGGQVFATFVITNTSNVPIEFRYGKLRVENAEGWKELRIPPPPILDASTILEPLIAATNHATLPPDVRRWQIGFNAHTPGARTRLWRILPQKIGDRFAGAITRWVSDDGGQNEDVWGHVIDATPWMTAHPGAPILINVPFREVVPRTN